MHKSSSANPSPGHKSGPPFPSFAVDRCDLTCSYPILFQFTPSCSAGMNGPTEKWGSLSLAVKEDKTGLQCSFLEEFSHNIQFYPRDQSPKIMPVT